MSKRTFLTFVMVIGACLLLAPFAAAQDAPTPAQTGYVSVNGLEMYYEIHGAGEPLVVLHGAYMNIELMGMIISPLAEARQVIALEFQGHGRTADIDRPFSYEQLADDVAAFMDEIGVENADIFGYSLGGGTALQLAIRHPEKVRKLVVASAAYSTSGWHDDLIALFDVMTPDMFAGTPIVTDYERLAPNPENFGTLVEKIIQLNKTAYTWSAESIQAITAPTLVIAGDSDSLKPEHAVDLFRLRGGGVNGDLTGLPNAQLAIIPGATHVSVLMRVDLLIPMITSFLDTPFPAGE